MQAANLPAPIIRSRIRPITKQAIRRYRAQGCQAQRLQAQERAERLRDDIAPLVSQGLSLRAIAARLTADEIKTPRKGAWNAEGVRSLIARLELRV
jgi:hypothetical protein